MKFTAGRERYMMHCNDIEKCLADQSSKGMKDGLHLLRRLKLIERLNMFD